jgi:hypothetical protein
MISARKEFQAAGHDPEMMVITLVNRACLNALRSTIPMDHYENRACIARSARLN